MQTTEWEFRDGHRFFSIAPETPDRCAGSCLAAREQRVCAIDDKRCTCGTHCDEHAGHDGTARRQSESDEFRARRQGARIAAHRPDFHRAAVFLQSAIATAPYPYDADAPSGSNLGPTNPALRSAIEQRIAALQAADPGQRGAIPVDLVTTSASGLDPDITPAAVQYQLARHLSPAVVQAMIRGSAHARQCGVPGEPRGNVLELDLRLDGFWSRC
ncbi:MAG: potassium-transporting ATPase subunit C [Metallibacterium sp.]